MTALYALQAIDSALLKYLVGKTLEKSASVHLLFAFEYVILASAIISTFLKYTLSMIDAWLEGRWEQKGVYVFYLELLTDMLHLFVYLVFFVIVFTNFGLPVHLVRPSHYAPNLLSPCFPGHALCRPSGFARIIPANVEHEMCLKCALHGHHQ